MLIPPLEINQSIIDSATRNSAKKVDRMIADAKRAENDVDRDARLEAGKCKACFYLGSGGLVLHAFHERKCGCCDTVTQFTNSFTDVLCKPCADKRGLCVHCAGMRNS